MIKRLDDDFDVDELLSNDSSDGIDFKKLNKPMIKDNELLLPSGKIIVFNSEQYEGIKKIRKWLKNDVTFFLLAGYAGSGKSTCIKKIIDEYKLGLAVSAPTHKSKKVIARTTGKPAETLHALLGLRPDLQLDAFNPNQPIFSPIAIPRIGDYNLVIIDEVSMMNNEFFELIKNKAKDTGTKIILMGDPAQIPPVKEVGSVIFTASDIESHWLTKIERQEDSNPLTFIYDDLRNNLESIDGGFKRKSNMNEKGEGVIFTVNKKEFRKIVLEKFKSKEFKLDSDYCKGIAWKNETVTTSNKIIRDEIFGNKSDIIEVNDLLMAYRTISTENMRFNIIENSEDYYVVEKSDLEENKYGIKGFNVKLKEVLSNGKFKYQDVFIVNSLDYNNIHLYAENHDFFRDMAKENKKLWRKYYEFRRNNMIMCDIEKHRNGQYRNDKDVICKDLDYSYFITSHKSQGSTYRHVMINERDINENWAIKERNQLRYTSLTRPTTSAIVLTTKIDE